jgi:H+-transporting ATPase
MIVILALLNDGAILSIAYDNVHYKNKPESWNMRMVLGVSTALGIIGVVSAFGLFYLGERVFHLDRAHIQTLMYLKLSVAGHLTIFLTRTRGPFWSIRPARILLIAVFGTQAVATLIAVYGLFMTPLGWGWAGLVWGYALLWFLVNDRIKLLAYRIFDPVKKAGANPEIKVATQPDPKGDAKTSAQPEAKTEPQSGAKAGSKPETEAVGPKPEAKSGAQPDAKTEAKPEVKDESKPDAQAGAKPGAKDEPTPQAKAEVEAKPAVEPEPEAKARTTADLTPQIAARAYELYERENHRDGQSAQNWEKAEQEIRATQAKTEPKAEANPTDKAGLQPGAKAQSHPDRNPKSAAKTEPAADGKAPAQPEATAVPPPAGKAEPKPDIKTDAKPADPVEPKPDGKAETKPEPDLKPGAGVSPELVKKVHKFYEQLGREDVRAVQEADEAEQKTPEAEVKK